MLLITMTILLMRVMMNNAEKIILIVSISAIIYYGYTKLADFKKSIDEKLDFL